MYKQTATTILLAHAILTAGCRRPETRSDVENTGTATLGLAANGSRTIGAMKLSIVAAYPSYEDNIELVVDARNVSGADSSQWLTAETTGVPLHPNSLGVAKPISISAGRTARLSLLLSSFGPCGKIRIWEQDLSCTVRPPRVDEPPALVQPEARKE